MLDRFFRGLLLLAFLNYLEIWALENGLARTPPMGWMPWERFRCLTDCVKFPRDCISEALFKRTADRLAADGFLDVGYEYVIIDDCWMESQRDSITGRLLPSKDRFPNGMKALSDYIHNLGLKFGIYHDAGESTCMFRGPGVVGHIELDAQTFADWGVDYVKMDGCGSENYDLDSLYRDFGQALNKTGRPIVYSCSWPFYQANPNFEEIQTHCNLWRYEADVSDSYQSVAGIMGRYQQRQDLLQSHAGPGHWNDPDMLVLGNFFLSYDASRLQMAIWAVLAAPLIMTNDLDDARPEIKDILRNRAIIAVDQDKLGIAGKCIHSEDYFQVWTRPITPISNTGEYSYAVAFVYHGGFTSCPLCPRMFEISLKRLNLTNPMGYEVWDLFNEFYSLGLFKPKDIFRTRINPQGVEFFKFTALSIY